MAATTQAGWRCPQCNRRFKQPTREHSCDVRSLDAHLHRGSPTVQATFSALQRALRVAGPHALLPVKTMILLRTTANVGNIIIRRDAVHVEFLHGRRLSSPRIHKSDRLGRNRYTHHVRLCAPEDVDDELTTWLREACDAGAGR